MMDNLGQANELDSGFCQVGSHRFRIAEVRDADRDAALQLFVTAFGYTPADGWYDWKYGKRAGQCGGMAVGLWAEDGQMVAHYAGFPRQLHWRGKRVQAIQIGDVMVAPEVRGLLTRKGPFFQVCTRFLATHVGTGNAYQMAFGFPNERGMQLGAKLDIYQDAGSIHQISWAVPHVGDTLALPPRWQWSALDGASNALTRRVGQAWRAMSHDFSDLVLGVRDAEYIRQRFINRPDQRYHVFYLRRWPFPWAAAVAVMRLDAGHAELLDVIGSRSAFSVVAMAAAFEAARVNAPALTAWASAEVVSAFSNTGSKISGHAATLAIDKLSELTTIEAKSVRWWWMGGDTDFL